MEWIAIGILGFAVFIHQVHLWALSVLIRQSEEKISRVSASVAKIAFGRGEIEVIQERKVEKND